MKAFSITTEDGILFTKSGYLYTAHHEIGQYRKVGDDEGSFVWYTREGGSTKEEKLLFENRVRELIREEVRLSKKF